MHLGGSAEPLYASLAATLEALKTAVPRSGLLVNDRG